MLFHSYTFFVFLAVVMAVARLRGSWAGKKTFLLVMSYLFYAAWNPPFVILLWVSTVADWFLARWMHRAQSTRRRKLCLWGSLAVNVGLLGYFKYGAFVLENFTALAAAVGLDYQPAAPNIIVPVGISFYTFQTLSYTLDIYRGHAKPWHSFLDYALYVTFFPQLVAGPIVRAVDFLPQCVEPKRATRKQLGWGMMLFVLGLFQKVVIADSMLAPTSEYVFGLKEAPGFAFAWAGACAFTIQIYCDFAGYSTCAIGLALCLRFELPENFRAPYGAIGFANFWRRWHISLSTWLRDYVYISMGGNRGGAVRTLWRLLATMLIGGLWHGASWTYVVWGGLHGVFLVIERLLVRIAPPWRFWHSLPFRLFAWLLTFVVVAATFVIFRAQSLGAAWVILRDMAGHTSSTSVPALRTFVVTAIILCIHWWMRDRSLEEVAAKVPWPLYSICVAIMACLVLLSLSGEENAFIYFQF
ncbi:MBOAT family protein [bacterium]|nr:MBOAT family protein [bacterium]